MARLDVYRINAKQCALDCQSNALQHLATRLTVPLLRLEDSPGVIGPLHPVFEIGGQRMVMATHLAGALAAKRLRDPIASLEQHEYEVQRALDTLVSGA